MTCVGNGTKEKGGNTYPPPHNPVPRKDTGMPNDPTNPTDAYIEELIKELNEAGQEHTRLIQETNEARAKITEIANRYAEAVAERSEAPFWNEE
ncbi:MAG: hypothetical protein F4X82_00210 [Candidatus Spechtbacteria bacterium SB0662_bin_43]|uniref:Uncharacterized protein n=1 Tax=Candidatus Spechtbacteria bacterium SB0662_bin_43 TaxID=2604897 RepID=A0A845DKV6_9BACT|nr:hypothetical protein [Candidatus Spechtbacteria bacterium SB0662_bin_43]